VSESANERCVVLFTKPARPGYVKTRLIGALTPMQAAELHSAFVTDMVDELEPGDFEVRVAWALEVGEDFPSAFDLPSVRQRGDELGERLFVGLSEGTEGYHCVAAIGSDHPEIGVEAVEEAFGRVQAGADVVIGPVEDGGYYLIAIRRSCLQSRIFEEIEWSTSTVLATTLERCRELGLAVELLEPGSDVDRPEDLARLRERLRAEPHVARHTARLLDSWDRPSTEADA